MLAKHSLIYLFARGLPSVIQFFAITIYTRLLMPSEYGQYALLLVAVNVGNIVFFQWLWLGILRFLPSYSQKRHDFLHSVRVTFLLLAVSIGFIFSIVCLIFTHGNTLWFLCIPLLLIFAAFETQLAFLRSELSIHRFVWLSLARSVLTVGFGVTALLMGGGLFGLIVGTGLGSMIPLLPMSGHVFKRLSFQNINITMIMHILKYSLPLILTFAMASIIFGTDRVLLGIFVNKEAVGLYAVAYDFTQKSMLVLMGIVNLAAFPLVIRKLESSDPDGAKREMKNNTVLLLLVSIPAATAMTILSSNLSDLMFGSSFRGATSELIPLIAPAMLLNGLKQFWIDLSFQVGKKTILQIWPVLIGAALNLVLNLWWIPIWGLFGSAYASLASYIAAFLFGWILSKQAFFVHFPAREAGKILMATFIMVLSLLPILQLKGPGIMAMEVFIGSGTYFGAALLLNTAGLREKGMQLIRSTRSKAA